MNRSLCAALLLAAAPAARAAECANAAPIAVEWPVAAQGANAGALKALEEYAFTLTGADEERKGIRTDAVLIVKDGAVIYERYARGFDATMPHLTWSASKSVTNAIVGAAVQKGLVSTADSICKHRPDFKKESCVITLEHLLQFSSGLNWKESYEGESNQVSSVLAMLYGEGRGDMAAFVAGHELRDPPGETYMYSTGDTTLLAGAVGPALTAALGERFPWKLLFDPLGMKSATFERDRKGTLVGASLFYATARDMARLAMLFQNDGCAAGERILPEGWVAATTAISEPYRKRAIGADIDGVQGRQMWLNRQAPGQERRPWPHAPEDAYVMIGHWGQSVTTVPSRKMIVVRFADDRDKTALDFDKFLSLALAVGE